MCMHMQLGFCQLGRAPFVCTKVKTFLFIYVYALEVAEICTWYATRDAFTVVSDAYFLTYVL
jgi:hypothetical protein